MELEKICQSDYKGSSSSGKGEIDISAKASLVKEVEEGRGLQEGEGIPERGKGMSEGWRGTRRGPAEPGGH